MEQVLVLNASYESLAIVPWQRAITLFYEGKVEIVTSYADRVIRSAKIVMQMPSVVRLVRFAHVRRRAMVPFTRANVYARDGHVCQYCLEPKAPEHLTYDHVIPVAQGGDRGWLNIVTACVPCNRKKGARTPQEAGMALKRTPRRPLVLPHGSHLTPHFRAPLDWASFMFGAS